MVAGQTQCNIANSLVRLGGNKKLLRQLIGFFQEDAPPLLTRLRSGLDAGNPDEVVRSAHKLKGLVANFDAEAATACAQRIETQAMAGDLSAVPADTDKLASLLTQLEQELAVYLQQG